MAPRRKKKATFKKNAPKQSSSSWNGFHHRLLSTPRVILDKNTRVVVKALENMTKLQISEKSTSQKKKNLRKEDVVCSICTLKFPEKGPTSVSKLDMKAFNELIFPHDNSQKECADDLQMKGSFSICSECYHVVKKVGRIINQIKNLEEELKGIIVCVKMAIKLKQKDDVGLEDSNLDEEDTEEETDYPNYFFPPSTPDAEFADEDDEDDEDVKPFILDLEDDPLDLDLLMENDYLAQPVTKEHSSTSKSANNNNDTFYPRRKRPGPKSKTKIISTTVSDNNTKKNDASVSETLPEEPPTKKRKSRLKAEQLLKTSLDAEEESQEINDDDDPTYTNTEESDADSLDENLKEKDADDDDEKTFPKRKPKARTWDLPCSCPTCGKSFINRKGLIPHIQSVHEGIRRFKCPVVSCGKEFYRKCNLDQHTRRIHTEKDPSKTSINCPLCGRTYSSQGSLTEHMKEVHEGIRPYKCQHEGCTRAFFRKREYNFHILRHEGKSTNLHLCSVCGKDFAHPLSLNNHLRDVHDQHPTQSRPRYSCTFPGCGKVITKKTNFNRHLETHRPQALRTTCSICQQNFPTLQLKQEHERSVHQGKSNFECRTCGKSFPRQISLNVHYKTHTNEQPFQCGKCNKKFKYKSSYLSHTKTVCGTDQDEIERIRKDKKDAQTKHRRKEKKFGCELCDHKFMNVTRLQDHLRRVHHDNNPQNQSNASTTTPTSP